MAIEQEGLLGDLLQQFGLQLLASRGPNLGANVGQAGLATLQYKQQQEQLARERARQAQQDQLLGYQIKGAQRGEESAQREDDFLKQIPGLMNKPMASMAPTQANAQAMQEQPYDRYMRLANAAMQAGAKGNAAAYAKLAEQYKPKFKQENQTARDAQGRPVILQLGEGGERQEVAGYSPYEKPISADLGNQMAFIDPTTMQKLGSFGMGVSPNTSLTSQVTMRGQNMTDARARELNAITREGQQSQIVNDPNAGIQIVNKGTGISRPAVNQQGVPLPSENQAKRTSGANRVLALLDEAERILPDATNSYLGRGMDYAVRATGNSLGGDRATARLQAIEGDLLSQMPRMEGPQSNYDVQNYKIAAGQLADATLPREVRQAALETIRDIQTRYAQNTQGIAPQSQNAPQFRLPSVSDITAELARRGVR
jgi:hypothetical protein